MKKGILFIALLFTGTFSYAQLSFGNQVGKKDVKSGTISFEKTTAANGDLIYGFKMKGLVVGPNMVLHTDGKTTFVNYNKDSQMDGTLIATSKSSGTIELYTYRKNVKDGPAFAMAGGKVAWSKQFKDDKIDPKGYKVNHSADFYPRNDGKSFDGFTIDKYDNGSYAIGYFAYGRRAYPIIHVWKDGDNYMGQCIQGVRKEFGVYFNADGTKYVGAWDENCKEGLGFMVDKNGEITEKGYYDNGKLIIAL
jgi:hypothetical protein